MKSRLLVALAAVLVITGLSFAQPPMSKPPEPLPPPKTEVPSKTETPAPSGPPGSPTEGPAPGAPCCSPDWGCGCACPGPQFWASAELLAGWFSGDKLPVLITTSPAGTDRSVAGVLGQSSTIALFGGNKVNDESRLGARLGAGYWFDPDRRYGFEAGGMVFESQAELFSASSATTPILARPFVNAATGAPDVSLIAFPGSSTGSVDARVSSGNFYELHLDLTEKACDCGGFHLTSLLGYRFYRYDEGLHIRQVQNPTSTAFVTGTQVVNTDDFTAKNEFHGCDLGVRAEFCKDPVSLTLLAKVAIGGVSRTVGIHGQQVVSVPGVAPVTQQGGVFALASNIGDHSTQDWAAMPEFGITFGWQVRCNVRVTLGYSMLWLDNIARAADQIDPTINRDLLPPANRAATATDRPAVILNRKDVWFQSANLGVEVRY
jgi:hypothetical protein